MISQKNNIISGGNFNSVQLNIVSWVDVANCLYTRSAEGNVYMSDNNVNSKGRGTPKLQTLCKQGQALNWIIYAMDAERRPNGQWPPSVKINNLVFLNEDGTNVEDFIVVNELKIFGGPDKVRSPYTPVYYYWAGIVGDDIPPGIYNYRFVLEIQTADRNNPLHLNFNTPSLKVISNQGL